MYIIGNILALIIGASLGLIGGGGAILAVPILVYLLDIDPVLATAYSLFLVGVASLVGAIQKFRKGLVSIKTALVFAFPSLVAVYITRLYIVPAIPETLLSVSDYIITKRMGIMLFFALMMLSVALSMLRHKPKPNQHQSDDKHIITYNYPLIALQGIVLGVITSLVGAGGGFLIIPILVLLSHLPMKLAVGTSLSIIAINSLVGFAGDLQAEQKIDWIFLLIFTLWATIGIFAGNYLSNFIAGSKLKTAFGWFLVCMTIYIVSRELII